jgi:hypothetical protein
MTSPNLAVPHVAAAQNQKEVTINDATDALDLAMTATLDVDCAAGGTITVSQAQIQRHVRVRLVGAPTAPFIVELHATPRLCAIANDSGQTATVQITSGSGTSVDVELDAQVLVHVAATGVTLVGAPPVGAPPVVPGPEVAQVYDFGMVTFDAPAAGAVMGKIILPRAVTLPGDFAGAQGHVDTAPDASFVISVSVNLVEVGTVTIGTDGAVVFATTGGAGVGVLAGSIVRFVAPAAVDPSIAGIAITLAGEVA